MVTARVFFFWFTRNFESLVEKIEIEVENPNLSRTSKFSAKL